MPDDMDRFDTPEELDAAFVEWTKGDGPAVLQAELDELEATDPAVAAAAASYDRMVERVLGRPVPAVCCHREGDGTVWEHPGDGTLPCGRERGL